MGVRAFLAGTSFNAMLMWSVLLFVSFKVPQEKENTESFLSRISGRVLEGIPSPSRTGDNIVETSLAPVEVLDVLGFSGYRVVGVAPHNNKMVDFFLFAIFWNDAKQISLRPGLLKDSILSFEENSDQRI